MNDTESIREAQEEQERRQRQKYTAKVYLIASTLLILSFMQWTVVKFFLIVSEFFKGHFFLPLIFLIIAIILITLFVFFEDIRFTVPLNYIFVIVIVELATFGLTSGIVHISFPRFASSILLVIVLFAVFTTIGIYMPRDITYDIAILFAVTILFFISSVIFLSMAVLAQMNFSVLFYGLCIGCTAVMFLIYHTQTIHGGRYAEMRYKDGLMASLLLYSDFMVLYLISIFILRAIMNKDANIYAFKDLMEQDNSTSNCTEMARMVSNDFDYEIKF